MEATFPALRTLSPEEWDAYVNDPHLRGRGGRGAGARCPGPDDHWPPDLVVRDGVEFGGCLAAEALGLPHAIGGFCFFGPPGIEQALFGAPLAALRASLGLPPDPELRMHHRYLSVVPTIPGFVGPEQAVAPVVHFLRPVPFDQSGDERLPDWAAALPARPTVYASLGTIFNHSPGLFAAILAGLRDEPLTLILTVGRNQDPADFGPQPGNVRIARYVPQTLLLPYCDLVVTHGGFNTVQAALSQGLPLVIVPLGADQPLNAAACAAMGVGRVVEPEERTPRNDPRRGTGGPHRPNLPRQCRAGARRDGRPARTGVRRGAAGAPRARQAASAHHRVTADPQLRLGS